MTAPEDNPDAKTIRSCHYWADEMDRTASVMEKTGNLAAVDGNRAIATTLRDAAALLKRKDMVTITAAVPVCDACGWQGDPVDTLDDASRIVRAHMSTCAEVREIVNKSMGDRIEEALDRAYSLLTESLRTAYCTPPLKPTTAPAAETDPTGYSLVQCQFDSVDFPAKVVEAIDSLDDRLRVLERGGPRAIPVTLTHDLPPAIVNKPQGGA